MEAGALGFSTSRTLNHRTSDGQPTPTLTAAEDELMGIALGLKAAGRGVLQFVSDFADPAAEFGLMRRLVEASGRPLSFSLLQGPKAPNAWRDLLAALSAATADGLPMRAQVAGRGVGVLLGFELTLNPFSHTEAWKSLAGLPLEARMARLADAAFRAALLDDAVAPGSAAIASRLTRDWDNMFLMAETPEYEPTRQDSVSALARARGVAPEEVALEHMMARGGRGMLYLPFLNYADGGLDPAYDMLRHPDCVAGLSDGGAHVGMICDGSFPTTNLTLWARDRTRGPHLPLEHMVRLQTRATAEAVGLLDRGLVAPGLRADLNVIDFDRLAVDSPTVGYDLPGGGRRLLQRARGYVATLVAGQVTYRDGEPTGALPGRLVRGAQDAPVALAAE
jgi:N-acyl-D-aspartate/D-glutamate deacylase